MNQGHKGDWNHTNSQSIFFFFLNWVSNNVSSKHDPLCQSNQTLRGITSPLCFTQPLRKMPEEALFVLLTSFLKQGTWLPEAGAIRSLPSGYPRAVYHLRALSFFCLIISKIGDSRRCRLWGQTAVAPGRTGWEICHGEFSRELVPSECEYVPELSDSDPFESHV